MRAAVLFEPRTPLSVEEVSLEEPGPGEVKVRLAATGVCHTDVHRQEGNIGGPLPVVLGHEGAGIVEAVGPGVRSVAPGDHVVLYVIPSCGLCEFCLKGQPYWCSEHTRSLPYGTLITGAHRLSRAGQPLNHFFGQSSFAEYAVVAERTAVKVRPDAPLDAICLLACGASTGIGAVLHAVGGDLAARVAIFGCGGVGQSAILAAKLLHAGAIIAVDLLENKLAMARDLGATETINSTVSDPVQAIRDLTGGGADYSFELIGSPDAATQALSSVRTGGKTVLVGGPGSLTIPAGVTRGKNLIWTTGGNIVPGTQIPRLVELYMSGALPLDRLITRAYPLDGINDAFAAMKTGEVARSVIRF